MTRITLDEVFTCAVVTYTTELIWAIDLNQPQGHFSQLWIKIDNQSGQAVNVFATVDDIDGTFATYSATEGLTVGNISDTNTTSAEGILSTETEFLQIVPQVPEGNATLSPTIRPIVAERVNIYITTVGNCTATDITMQAHLIT